MAVTRAPGWARILLACCTLAAPSARAAADDTPPWQLGAGLEITHDDNLFRAPPGSEQSDTARTAFLNGGLNLRLGRQRLAADLSVRRADYATHSELDNTGYSAGLTWDGSTAGNLSWHATALATRTLVSYAAVVDAAQRVPDLQSSRQLDARLQLGGYGRWAGSLDLGWRSIDHSAAAFDASDFASSSFGLSATWQPLGPLSITVGPRWTHGRYPDGSAPLAFERQDLDVSAVCNATGASTITARLSATRQHYTEGIERDLDGATGQVSWAWVPTGRLRLDAFAARDTGSQTSFFAIGGADRPLRIGSDDSRLTTTLNLAASYGLTGKVSLSASLQQVQRRLSVRNAAGAVPLGGDAGAETTRSASLALRWTPTPRSRVDCGLGHQQRGTDTALSSPFRATTLGCSAQLTMS